MNDLLGVAFGFEGSICVTIERRCKRACHVMRHKTKEKVNLTHGTVTKVARYNGTTLKNEILSTLWTHMVFFTSDLNYAHERLGHCNHLRVL